jgi:hypothetical protein
VAYVPGALPGGAGCQVPAEVIAGEPVCRALISAASSRSRSPVSTVAG